MDREPAGLPGVVGHQAAQTWLTSALSRGRLHHALVVSGPAGVGKATLALGLGCALHCRERPGLGCGTCDRCRRVLGRTHAGVEWIVPEKAGDAIPVAAARVLRARLGYAPFEGSIHLVVIDPADAMTEEAMGALLKVVEEPRPGIHFVLLAAAIHRILPTILSRCQPIRVGLLADAEVDAIVRHRAPEAAPERRELAVRLAAGRPGHALELLSDPALEGVVTLTRTAATAAAAGPRGVFAEPELWRDFQQATAGPSTGRPGRERAVARRMAELWLAHLRERIRGAEGLPGLPDDAASTGELVRRLAILVDFHGALDRNPNVRLAIERALLELGRTCPPMP